MLVEQPSGFVQPATLMDHVHELRNRTLVVAAVLVGFGCLTYLWYEPLLNLLRSPLGQTLYYSNPQGSFSFILHLCLVGGVMVALPVLIYNIVMFVRPAFDNKLSRRRVLLMSFWSALLAITGALFGFMIIVPGSLGFFGGFEIDGLQALIAADSYLSFVLNILITFMIVFQIPLVMSFIDNIKPMSPTKLLKGEKWVVLGSLIVSLLVPFAFDVTTSMMIALPIIALYNICLVIISIRSYKRSRQPVAEDTSSVDLSAKDLKAFIMLGAPLPVQKSVQALDILPKQPRVLALDPNNRVIRKPVMPRVRYSGFVSDINTPSRASA